MKLGRADMYRLADRAVTRFACDMTYASFAVEAAVDEESLEVLVKCVPYRAGAGAEGGGSAAGDAGRESCVSAGVSPGEREAR